MLELQEALARVLADIPAPSLEEIPLTQACGRILGASVFSPMDLPPFDNSAMDGYAVRAAEVALARPDAPVRLRLGGRVAPGAGLAGEVAAGAGVRLFTGSPLPRGADAVVMQEDTRLDPAEPEVVLVLQPASAGEFVRRRGEDVKCGSLAAAPGDPLTAGRITLLAALGQTRVLAGRCPLVGLLATGSELREPGEPLGPGQIYECNCLALAAVIRRAGAVPILLDPVPDTLDATRSALAHAFARCDAVVTSGGVSVGELDFVRPALAELGGKVQFWKVAIQPGRPFMFGRWGEKLLFGLPGNPVSALVTSLLLIRPALLRWQGANDVALPAYPGVLAEPLANPGQRPHFLRVRVDAAGNVYSAGLQASHALSSLAAASGLVEVPPQTTLSAGAVVKVLRWD